MIKIFENFINEDLTLKKMRFDHSLMTIYNRSIKYNLNFDKYLNMLSNTHLYLKKNNKIILEGKLKFGIITGMGSKYGRASTPRDYDELIISNEKIETVSLKMPSNFENGDFDEYSLSNYKQKFIELDPYGEEDWEEADEKFRLNESIKGLKDYSIENILLNYNGITENIYIKYNRSFSLYKKRNGENLTFSQFKKNLNNIFINKSVVFVSYSPKTAKNFLILDTIKSLSVDKDGNIKSFNCIKNGVCLYNEDYGVIDMIKYNKLLKTLIGQRILFYLYSRRVLKDKKYITQPEKSIIIKLKDSILKNDDIIFVDENGEKYEVDVFREIIKAPIYSAEDPYGEEDWDEADEKFSWQKNKPVSDIQFVNINREITNYIRNRNEEYISSILSYFRENLIGKKIKIRCSKIYKPYKFVRLGHVKKGKIEDGYFEITLKDIENVSVGNVHSIIFNIYDDEYKYVATSSNLMNCMALRKINRKVTEFDPLGEEDWDD